MAKTYRYKVSGTVKFFVDDIFAKNSERAIKQVTGNIHDDVGYAGDKGNLEIVGELNAENLGPCKKNKFYETRQC